MVEMATPAPTTPEAPPVEQRPSPQSFLIPEGPITMKSLLEAGVHFGHQKRRWNPKMKQYIFAHRNGIHIIDLQKTLRMVEDAARFMTETVAQGAKVLLVGTKKQAHDTITSEAERSGSFYVTTRWLGGTLRLGLLRDLPRADSGFCVWSQNHPAHHHHQQTIQHHLNF